MLRWLVFRCESWIRIVVSNNWFVETFSVECECSGWRAYDASILQPRCLLTGSISSTHWVIFCLVIIIFTILSTQKLHKTKLYFKKSIRNSKRWVNIILTSSHLLHLSSILCIDTSTHGVVRVLRIITHSLPLWQFISRYKFMNLQTRKVPIQLIYLGKHGYCRWDNYMR